jgi:hypothetical protein
MIQRTACLTRRLAADRRRGHYRARVTLRQRVGRDAGRLGQLAIAAGLPFGAVVLTGAVNGGYFPSEWGWPTLAFVLVCVLAVLVRERIVLTRLEWVAIGSLAAFALWTLLSGGNKPAPPKADPGTAPTAPAPLAGSDKGKGGDNGKGNNGNGQGQGQGQGQGTPPGNPDPGKPSDTPGNGKGHGK